jgi:hypothetical protein
VTPRFRRSVAPLALAALAAACTGDPASTGNTEPSEAAVEATTFVVEVASSDLFAGEPQRVNVGVLTSTPEGGVRLVTGGEIDVTFAPFEGGRGTPVDGAGRFLPAPGADLASERPTLSAPADARGVYEVTDVSFDEPGVWEATATFEVDGAGPFEVASTPFNVLEEPAYPAPGERALKTENLTIDSKAPPAAIDSGAATTGEIPDPELHRWTIADALEQGRPIVALFATPAYCESILCGPVTSAVQDLAAEYDDEAVFVHVEIWRKNPTVLNEAAADWLYRNENLTEPWLYVIDDEGIIVDRWSPLFDPEEVGDLLARMPDMRH